MTGESLNFLPEMVLSATFCYNSGKTAQKLNIFCTAIRREGSVEVGFFIEGFVESYD